MPYSTGFVGELRLSVPIVNQVERSPSAARALEPLIVRVPFEPTRVSERTRPSAAAAVWMSSSVPREPSRLPSRSART